MQVNIKDVIIKKRARKDEGDLTTLMESLDKYGQLNPIILNSKMELIAGFRRLTAAKKLGWTKISATIVEIHDKADMLAIEIDENVQRLAFDDADLAEAYKKLEKLRRKNIFVRIGRKIRDFFKKLFGKKEPKAEVKQEAANQDEPVAEVSAEPAEKKEQA
ncbi:MAG: ParB N-terminal domain-containing protein [Spirochaetia bacterium]|nr:ParB N-terminal domain-containing protein [Spirochaetia bacterium]